MRVDSRPASGRIDWSQLWCPGPRRRFSAQELALAGQDRPGPTFYLVLGFNLLLVLAQVLWLLPSPARWLTVAALLPLTAAGLWALRWVWVQPTRKRLNLAFLPMVLLAIPISATPKTWWGGREAMGWGMAVVVVCLLLYTMGLWALSMYRSHRIESRLRELDDQRRHTALQTQLLQAQIQPHFLFNSLAALDHWVSSGDARATPLLRSLTGYLRATLPLFNREQLRLGDELAAVREYLAVMQARVGERLRVEIEIEPGVEDQRLPPALLLTLVENAIEHGVMPKLGAACVRIEARRVDSMTQLRVSDDGPGLAAAAAAQSPCGAGHRGVGLANSRERLAQAFGADASLTLASSAETGGCVATLSLPLRNVAEGERTQ